MTEEERAEIWLDSFGVEYNKKMRFCELATTPHAMAEFLSRRSGEAAALVGKETAERMQKKLNGEYFRSLTEKYAKKGIECVAYSSPLYPEDLRQIRVHITPKGLELHRLVHQAIVKTEECALAGLSQEEQDTLKLLLTRMRENLLSERSGEASHETD